MSVLAAGETPAGAKPAHPLDGKWLVTEVWEGGEKNADEEEARFLTFGDGKLVAKMGEHELSAGFTLDDTKSPRWLVIQTEIDGETLTIPGIYEIGNGVLKLCHPQEPDGPRPASFDKAAEVVLVILKREPAVPADPEKPAPVPAPTPAPEAKEKP